MTSAVNLDKLTYVKLKSLFQPWLQILLGGLVLFLAFEQVFKATGRQGYFPFVLLLGAFTVPVAFVAFFYEHVRHREISMPLLTTSFVVGGATGLAAAAFLEFTTLSGTGVLDLVGVGLIEESVKLLFPIAMYVLWRFRHEADGLLFGIAAGMGFAGLETVAYGLSSFVQSQGNTDVLQQVLFLRGFLSPAGHAAWTGFVCAVLWRERERKGRATINIAVIGAFSLAISLHFLWNAVNTLRGHTSNSLAVTGFASLAIASISLTLVIRRYLEAKKSLALNKELPPA